MSTRKPDDGEPRAVICTGEGDRGALDFLRSLAYENIASVVVSTDSNDIASKSRYCRELVVIRPYHQENDAYNLNILTQLGQRWREKPVLYYGEDVNMLFISRNRDVLQQYYRFLMPPRALAGAFVDKTEFQRLAERHGFPVPATRFARSFDELVAISTEIKYPAFVKPAFTMNWTFTTPALREKYHNYKYALRQYQSAEEMLDWCSDLPLSNGGVLVQEYIEGSDREIYSLHAYFDERSRPLAYFVGRKIRTYPMTHGGSAYIETVRQPEVARIGIESLQKVNFAGIVKIDMKRNSRDGSFKILEVNPRFTLWESLGASAGVNLCLVAYHHLRGELVEPLPPSYDDGRKWLFFKQDMRAFVSGYWKTGEWTLWQYLKSLRGRKIYQLWNWRDPWPWCYSASRFLTRQVSRAAMKITGAWYAGS